MPAWKPSVTVAAVIERGGRFLFVEEVFDGRRVLNQPAGHLERDESLPEACVREVLEETAHHFAPEGLVGVYRWHYPPRDLTYLRFCFHGRATGEEKGRPLDKEIVQLHWLAPEELRARADMHRSVLVQRCVDDYLAGQRFPLELFAADFR